jgi:uncharacterized surface protein with fasciclin (FAS1) repeats
MSRRTSLLKATALALPFSLAAAAAQAADIVEAAKQNRELSRFSEAMSAAGLDQQLGSAGPFTVFAPSNRAFEQLPQGALDELMKPENQKQLTQLLHHHVIQGEAIAADDVLGEQTSIETMSGDILTVDGTSAAVLLVPTGLAGGTTPTTESSGMPMSEHQQEVLRSEPVEGQEGTAVAGEMPATEHQREVLAEGGQRDQQAAARTPTAAPSGMPVTEHQQEVLKSEPGSEQQQTAPAGATSMPATEHQRQALAEELPGEQQAREHERDRDALDIRREAAVVGPDIRADNGVLHVIDTVLVPESLVETLQGSGQRG